MLDGFKNSRLTGIYYEESDNKFGNPPFLRLTHRKPLDDISNIPFQNGIIPSRIAILLSFGLVEFSINKMNTPAEPLKFCL
ncbi:hypothetical protein CEXT_258721 [Caerostris extrusa]|uniref:Uncharacterized protein n=1 Tax=Caerostris extrusa TaxID=172846 RepID=A0AAV4X382_CAEEX|nr:hypothetical protein CEXT_258721 [Caerostris extrusa]